MIGDVYIDKPITTDDYHPEQKIEVDQKVFEQPKERTLLDDLKDNADEKKSQDNNQTKYEKISLADLLNEDDF